MTTMAQVVEYSYRLYRTTRFYERDEDPDQAKALIDLATQAYEGFAEAAGIKDVNDWLDRQNNQLIELEYEFHDQLRQECFNLWQQAQAADRDMHDYQFENGMSKAARICVLLQHYLRS